MTDEIEKVAAAAGTTVAAVETDVKADVAQAESWLSAHRTLAISFGVGFAVGTALVFWLH